MTIRSSTRQSGRRLLGALSLLVAGVLSLSLTACFTGFLPDDDRSVQAVEDALLSSDLGVTKVEAKSNVSGFGRKMIVWVWLNHDTITGDELFEILALSASATNASAHQDLEIVLFEIDEASELAAVEELNARWADHGGDGLLLPDGFGGMGASVSLKNLNKFLKEEGR